MIDEKTYTLSVENADGPIQLSLMNDKRGIGKRLLGRKGHPFRKQIASWRLTKKELSELIKDMREVMK